MSATSICQQALSPLPKYLVVLLTILSIPQANTMDPRLLQCVEGLNHRLTFPTKTCTTLWVSVIIVMIKDISNANLRPQKSSSYTLKRPHKKCLLFGVTLRVNEREGEFVGSVWVGGGRGVNNSKTSIDSILHSSCVTLYASQRLHNTRSQLTYRTVCHADLSHSACAFHPSRVIQSLLRVHPRDV